MLLVTNKNKSDLKIWYSTLHLLEKQQENIRILLIDGRQSVCFTLGILPLLYLNFLPLHPCFNFKAAEKHY